MALGGMNLASTIDRGDGAEREEGSGRAGADTDKRPALFNSKRTAEIPEEASAEGQPITSESLDPDLGLVRARPPKDNNRVIPDPLLDFCSPTKEDNASREIGVVVDIILDRLEKEKASYC